MQPCANLGGQQDTYGESRTQNSSLFWIEGSYIRVTIKIEKHSGEPTLHIVLNFEGDRGETYGGEAKEIQILMQTSYEREVIGETPTQYAAGPNPFPCSSPSSSDHLPTCQQYFCAAGTRAPGCEATWLGMTTIQMKPLGEARARLRHESGSATTSKATTRSRPFEGNPQLHR